MMKKRYITPVTGQMTLAACTPLLQASHGYPDVSLDDTTVSYEGTDDAFDSDESIAAKDFDLWSDGWDE